MDKHTPRFYRQKLRDGKRAERVAFPVGKGYQALLNRILGKNEWFFPYPRKKDDKGMARGRQ